jgi:site-specific DNA-methyltransferase (adenine-specific)
MARNEISAKRKGGGMKPYYQDDSCTIYHGDCREILPGLEPVDLVLTDPPYGINYASAWRKPHLRLGGISGDSSFPMWVFDIQFTIAMFVFCRWDNLNEIPSPKSFIVWDKGSHSMGDLKHEFGRQWEGCAFYPGPKHSFKKRPVDIIRTPKVNPSALVHPNEKPVLAVTPLIECHESGLILDPFMGSGVTVRAAKDLGRKAIGIEIEEKYCEISAKRLAQEVLII